MNWQRYIAIELLEGCCHTVAKLLLNSCCRLQLDSMPCNDLMLGVVQVYACDYVGLNRNAH